MKNVCTKVFLFHLFTVKITCRKEKLQKNVCMYMLHCTFIRNLRVLCWVRNKFPGATLLFPHIYWRGFVYPIFPQKLQGGTFIPGNASIPDHRNICRPWLTQCTAGMSDPWGPGGGLFADQLTLSQLGGGDILSPPHYYFPLPDFQTFLHPFTELDKRGLSCWVIL